MRKPKDGEYWVVRIDDGDLEIGQYHDWVTSSGGIVFTCGDEQGWYLKNHTVVFIRKIRI